MAPLTAGAPPLAEEGHRVRLRLRIRGAVQGVGFRPFVYRLATGLGLAGWVRNSPEGVWIEAEGPADRVEALARRIRGEAPPLASIQGVEACPLDPVGEDGFAIR